MNYIYTVWVNQEYERFTSISDALKFADDAVYRENAVWNDCQMIANAWVRFNQEDFQSAENAGWVHMNVTIVKETEDEMSVVDRFMAFILPRPKWDCGHYEMFSGVAQ